MIELTRLNGTALVVNSDLIQQAESSPDTTLTLVTGEKIVVCESTAEVIGLTVAYRARLMGEAAKDCPGGLLLASGSVLRALAAETALGTLDEIEPDSAMASRRRRTER